MNIANIKDVSPSVPSPKNPYTNKSDNSAKEDFMSLMAGSVSNIGTSISSNGRDVNSDISTSKVQDISKDSSNYSSVKDNISMKEDESIDVKSVKEAIEKFTEEVKEEIKEELGITEEELKGAMENLGLTFVDLTKPENLASLLKDLNGADDSVNLLLDTSIKDVFDAMGEFTGELFESTGLDTQGLIQIDGMELLEEPVEFTGEIELSDITVEKEAIIRPEINSKQAETQIIAEDNTNETQLSEDAEALNTIDSKPVSSKDNSQSSFDMSGNNTNQNQGSMDTATESVVNPQNNINDFSQNIADVDTEYEVPTYTNVNTQDVIDQIVSQARVSITAQVRSMEMELNPQHLGKLLMQVSESEGQVTARFLTQSESVKTALEGAIANLVERLNEQGVKVDAVEVSVGTHEFEQNLEQNFAGDAREDLNSNESGSGRNDNRSRGGINLGDAEYMEGAELSEEEEITASIMRTYGNTVNFKA